MLYLYLFSRSVVLNGGDIVPPVGGEMSPRGSELVLGNRGAASVFKQKRCTWCDL